MTIILLRNLVSTGLENMKIPESMHFYILLRLLAMGISFEIIYHFRLKDLDILLMKSVGKRVNVIPVIAKSDALTKLELIAFKKQVITIVF